MRHQESVCLLGTVRCSWPFFSPRSVLLSSFIAPTALYQAITDCYIFTDIFTVGIFLYRAFELFSRVKPFPLSVVSAIVPPSHPFMLETFCTCGFFNFSAQGEN